MCSSLHVLTLEASLRRTGRYRETPRAKKEVNASLSPHEKRINKTNGCIEHSVLKMSGMSFEKSLVITVGIGLLL